MKYFILSSEKPLNLSEINEEGIIIKKITPLVQKKEHFECLISILSAHSTIVIDPMSYYSAKGRSYETDKPINKAIKDCLITSMTLCKSEGLIDDICYIIYYEPFYILDIEIIFTKKESGYVFSLSPKSLSKIKSRFPDVNPMPELFISNEDSNIGELFHKNITTEWLSSLIGLESKIVERLKIKFIDFLTKKTSYFV
jgi:hypothetical protein